MEEARQTRMHEFPQGGPAGGTERRAGERSEPDRSGVTPAGKNGNDLCIGPAMVLPNPEVVEKTLRRRFTAAYKLRILKEVDALSDSGQIGALLRREGLYSSHLTTWRRQREAGTIQALQPKKRGQRRRPAQGAPEEKGGPQRPLHLRQRSEVEAMPRRDLQTAQ